MVEYTFFTEVKMTLLLTISFVALSCAQLLMIKALFKSVKQINMELDRNSSSIRGMKLLLQMMNKKAQEKGRSVV